MKTRTPEQLLKYLNETYARLHAAYENGFWLSYMGDHSKDTKMNVDQVARDVFRSNAELKKEVDVCVKISKDKNIKERLTTWSRFLSLYQASPEALAVKERVNKIEAKISSDRAKRKEGYIDPISNKFVEASENKMRTMMRTNADEAVRKACFEANEKLSLANVADYIQIIKGRNEFARLCGYQDFYDYKINIDEGMTKKELFSIFEDIYEKTKYAFKNVRDLEKTKPGLRKPWNFGYMLAGDFTKEEDQYFQFEEALSYWGSSFAGMGVDFQGGSLKLDLLDRKGKHNNGFCHWPQPVQYINKDGKEKRIPGISQFTSNAVLGQVGSGIQGLDTFFHEGGHAAHYLNTVQKDICLNTEYPPATVSWAETQSMFMDSVSSSIEWRVRYARDKNGSQYPFDLFERKVQALHFLEPLSLMGIMFVVFFEKEIYECKNLTEEFVIKTAKKVFKKYFDRSEESTYVLNVSHIYSWESSAYYHGYGLAELGVQQWRDYFYKKYGYIVDNPNVGKEMSKVWRYGSLYPSNTFIKMATGKKLSPDAFIKYATMPTEALIRDGKKRVERVARLPIRRGPVKLNAAITMLHGKQKIADNSKSFEDMEQKYRKWLGTQRQP